jgi:hypothetical protein
MAVRSLILVLAVLALTAMPAFARGGGGGGHGGGGGFHRRDRFDRFHRLGFFGDLDSRGLPYPAYSYAPPLVIQLEPGVSVQQAASAATPYWYHCAENDGYYPYTQQCPGGWREVPTTAMG